MGNLKINLGCKTAELYDMVTGLEIRLEEWIKEKEEARFVGTDASVISDELGAEGEREREREWGEIGRKREREGGAPWPHNEACLMGKVKIARQVGLVCQKAR